MPALKLPPRKEKPMALLKRLLAFSAILALLAACSPKPQAAAKKTTLRLPATTTFATTDPHYTAQNSDFLLNALLYESFYEIDNKGNSEPRLATSYDVSADGTVYTYHLKEGVKWQTGGTFTSDDVLYSIARAQESPYTASYLAGLEETTAPDSNTVVFRLSSTSPTFHININRVPFLSKAATEGLENGFANAYPGGTGPFSIKEWAPDQKVTLVRNPDYHGKPASVEEIQFSVFADTLASLRAFETGEVDFSQVLANDWERINSSGKYKTQLQESISVVFATMNNQQPPFDNPLVRQAINCAINKEDMIAAAVDGNGRPQSTLGNYEMVFGIPKPGEIFEYSFDPDKAKSLLAEAGYPNGLTLETPFYTLASDEFAIPAQVLQSQLANVGIAAEIQTVEQSALVTDYIMGNYGIGIIALSLDQDASAYSTVYTTGGIDALNLARYSNPIVDESFQKANETLDENARKEYFKTAFDQASKDAAYAPMYSMLMPLVMDPNLYADINKSYYYWGWN
jgi:peptide/nickel transport system substrate-binding protein